MSKDDDKSKYPYGIILFLIWYFCEKYCFHCYKTILVLYLTEKLGLSLTFSASIFHAFLTTSYLFPLLGGILSDAWLGSFCTIVHLSILYAVGTILTCLSTFPMNLSLKKAMMYVGIFIVGIGIGSLKPCAPVFGGEQFEDKPGVRRQHFYSIFYAVTNAANIAATFISPVLRGDIECFDEDSCYSLAFGFASGIFIVSLIVFVACKSFYKIYPGEGSAFISVLKCVFHALARKAKSKGETKAHWLDYADDKFSKELITDIKSFLGIFMMVLPIPCFWALYAQQSSTWLLQAATMDGEFFGFRIKPDHMQLVNPVLIVLLMPLFDYLIYPVLTHLRLCITPIQKMTVGGLLTAIAFTMSGFIQMQIEVNIPERMPSGVSELSIINNSPCWLDIQGYGKITLKPFKDDVLRVPREARKKWEVTPSGCFVSKGSYDSYNFDSEFMAMLITVSNDDLSVKVDEKPPRGRGLQSVAIIFSTDFTFRDNKTDNFILEGDKKNYSASPDPLTHPMTAGMTYFVRVMHGKYVIHMPSNETSRKVFMGSVEIKRGGSYIVGVFTDSHRNISKLSLFTLTPPYSVSILFQIPQITVLSAGEIMLVVTGLDFTYSQAPVSLRSVVQSIWLLARSLGNALVICIENVLKFKTQSNQFYMYAALLTLSTLIFAVLGHFYRYKEVDDS